MKKKIVALLLALLLFGMVFAGCGGAAIDGGDEALHGSWDWNGSPYYRFNEDGSGRMFNQDIRWGTDGDTLNVCITPALCRTRCSAPLSGTYTFSDGGNTLHFSGYTYTRG